MGKHKKKSKIQKTKDHYFSLYKSYRQVFCPALQTDVLFTNWGWEHLFEGKWRTSREVEERLKLLPLGKKLIAQSTTIQKKRFQNYHDYYEFTALMDGVQVVVIVVEDKKKYYFFSVYKE